jgi:hypothetical protein
MLQTYKAVLRGNHLEWSGDAPGNLEEEQPVEVHVTILQEANASSSVATRGQRMADTLEKLASINSLSEVADPSAWQREERQDRQLPGRDV